MPNSVVSVREASGSVRHAGKQLVDRFGVPVLMGYVGRFVESGKPADLYLNGNELIGIGDLVNPEDKKDAIHHVKGRIVEVSYVAVE